MCSSMVLNAVRSSSTSGSTAPAPARASSPAEPVRLCEVMPRAVWAMSLKGFSPRRSTVRPITTSPSRASAKVTTWTQRWVSRFSC